MSSYPNNNNRLNHLLIWYFLFPLPYYYFNFFFLSSSTQQALNNSSPIINLYSTNTDNLISRANQQLRTSELQTNDTMNINEEQFYSLDNNNFPSKTFFHSEFYFRYSCCKFVTNKKQKM